MEACQVQFLCFPLALCLFRFSVWLRPSCIFGTSATSTSGNCNIHGQQLQLPQQPHSPGICPIFFELNFLACGIGFCFRFPLAHQLQFPYILVFASPTSAIPIPIASTLNPQPSALGLSPVISDMARRTWNCLVQWRVNEQGRN